MNIPKRLGMKVVMGSPSGRLDPGAWAKAIAVRNKQIVVTIILLI